MLSDFSRWIEQRANLIIRFIASSWFLRLTFAWFIIQAVYFAITTRYGLPPDENYHLSYIQLFADNSPSPFLSGQGDYFILREAVRNPFFLYHYLLSFPYLIFKDLLEPTLVLRLINVGLGIASLYIIKKLAELIKVTPFVRNITIFMLSNTLMFVFLFGSVNYDNLFIFLSIAGVYVLLLIRRNLSAKRLLVFVAIILAGLLVKINFLPIAFILSMIAAFILIRSRVNIVDRLRKSFAKDRRLNIFLSLTILTLGILFTHRYVANAVRYQTFAPECQQVQTLDYCRKSALFVRNEQVFGDGRKDAPKGLLSYSVEWSRLMMQRTYGVYAHEKMSPNRFVASGIILVLIVGVISFIRLWRRNDTSINILLLVTSFYMLALFAENFRTYKSSGILQLAVHGRYAFAVLPFVYLILTNYTFKLLRNNVVRVLFVILLLALFALSSLPTYLRKSSPEWRTTSADTKLVAAEL